MTTDPDTAAQMASPRFTVRTEAKGNGPGHWESKVVTVLDGGVPCGSYERGYPSFAESTFCPFEVDGHWYALYSGDYTATRIMSLPDCRDIGGEAGDACGFCPVELWVPRYRVGSFDMTHDWKAGQKVEPYVQRHEEILWPDDTDEMAEFAAKSEAESGHPQSGNTFNHALSEWRSCPFGFVAGCIWGDDSSWKIEFIDLSRAAEGVLTRSDKFGYAQMPARMTLREAIDLSRWRPGSGWIGVSHTTFHNLATGETDSD